jgi:hypothetical protein
MANYRIEADLSALLGVGQRLEQATLPNLQYAVSTTAGQAAVRWQKAVNRAKLWSVEKDAYSESIAWRMTGPLEALVYTEYKYAQDIETGRPARDLKTVLPTAKKARSVKSGPHTGQKYLIIPFRHNVPTTSGVGALAPQMPPKIYKLAKALAPSNVRGVRTRLSATGVTVPQNSYSWGDRLPAGLAPKLKSSHATDPYAALVRLDTSVGRAKRSTYLTMRTMGAWSSGWIVPAKPGLFLAKGVADAMGPAFNEAIANALKADAGIAS